MAISSDDRPARAGYGIRIDARATSTVVYPEPAH
jgi:hypothetical protein